MARLARLVVPGLPHHITQRGNNRREIFLSNDDRFTYLSLIRRYSEKYGVDIIGYCLMTNHIHFIAVPTNGNSLAKAFQTSHMQYAKIFNEKQDTAGHLWHCRYFSCVLGEQHLLQAARYIESNPVRAGMVDRPWDWKWSSAAFHAGIGSPDIPVGDLFKYISDAPESWQEFVCEPENPDFHSLIKDHTRTGRPVLSDCDIRDLEITTGRMIREKPMGRPRKNNFLL